jgi:hypothetical protein
MKIDYKIEVGQERTSIAKHWTWLEKLAGTLLKKFYVRNFECS